MGVSMTLQRDPGIVDDSAAGLANLVLLIKLATSQIADAWLLQIGAFTRL